MNEPNIWRTLYKSITPMLSVSRLFGLLTFNYSSKGLSQSKLTFIGNITALLVYTPITAYGIIIRLRYRAQVLYKTTDIIQLIVCLAYIEIAWIMSMVYQKKHIKLLNELKNYDKHVSRMHSHINYDKTTKYVRYSILARVVLTFTSIAGQIATLPYSFRPLNMFIFYILNFFPTVINSAICLQTGTYVHIIGYRFELLNKMIHNIVLNVNTQPIRTVESTNNRKFSGDLVLLYNICAMHHHLAKLIKLFNKTFGPTLLVMFGVSFVSIVVGLYFPCASFRSEQIDWATVVNYLLLSLPFIVDTIWVCYGCNSTIEEFKKSGILIHKIDTDDYDMKDEIEMFSLQIANEQVEFNAAGFFPINFTLLFSIIGGVTTYIIILIQLSNP